MTQECRLDLQSLVEIRLLPIKLLNIGLNAGNQDSKGGEARDDILSGASLQQGVFD
jgi:hypothetical protein